MDKEFGKRIRKAAIFYLEHQHDYEIVMPDFRSWIMARTSDEDGDILTIFVKVVGDKERFKKLSHYDLRDEFETVAAAWLSATDTDDCFGPIRGDVININVLGEDRALLRYEKDAVGMR